MILWKLYLNKHNFKKIRIRAFAMDNQSDFKWKTVLDPLPFLPLLNIYSLSCNNLIIFTIVISTESRSRHTSLNVTSSSSMKLCAAQHSGSQGGAFSGSYITADHRILFTVHICQAKWALAKWQISSHIWHGWQVESRIKSHWLLHHNICTSYMHTKEIHILHFSGFILAHTVYSSPSTLHVAEIVLLSNGVIMESSKGFFSVPPRCYMPLMLYLQASSIEYGDSIC